MDYPEIELHALGDAIGIAVKVGELLCRSGFTNIKSIQTTTLSSDEPGKTPEAGNRPLRRGKKAKLIIKLSKAEKFDELMKNFKIQKS